MKWISAIDRGWRVCATAISFTVFMVWGFSLGVFLFPALGLLWRDRCTRRERFMAHLNWVWRTFIRLMEVLRAFDRIEVRGLEHFAQNTACLVIANHLTLVDIVALGSRIRNFNCVVKTGLWNHPFFGTVVRACEFIPNVGSSEFIALCERGFAQNRPLIIFPQGSRTPPDAPLRFQRGAAQIAVRTRVPIVPVVVTSEPLTLAKGVPWYRVPPRAPKLVLRIHPPLRIPDAVWNEPSVPQQVRALNAYLEQWYEKALAEVD